jgi:hypothetical protein
VTVGAAVPVLILSGTVGVGKTTVLGAVSDLLDQRGVPHLAVDVDALSYTWPRPADDPYGQRIALANLAAVWANARAAGASHAVLARVVEQTEEIDGFRTAIPGAEVVVARLTAPAALVAERLRRREHGSGLRWHLARAPELAAVLDATGPANVTVVDDGDRSPVSLAEEVLRSAGWG